MRMFRILFTYVVVSTQCSHSYSIARGGCGNCNHVALACRHISIAWVGGREGGWEGGWVGGREGGWEGGWVGGREGGRAGGWVSGWEGGREGDSG